MIINILNILDIMSCNWETIEEKVYEAKPIMIIPSDKLKLTLDENLEKEYLMEKNITYIIHLQIDDVIYTLKEYKEKKQAKTFFKKANNLLRKKNVMFRIKNNQLEIYGD
ncbi:hypothetical protein KY314_03600 [Candidatus Woesearchaeota archaeon]|nr:hypothetical protein [Candidatus Woesearchaeota archaeon]